MVPKRMLDPDVLKRRGEQENNLMLSAALLFCGAAVVSLIYFSPVIIKGIFFWFSRHSA